MREGFNIGKFYENKPETGGSACLFCQRPKLEGHVHGCPVKTEGTDELLEKVDAKVLAEYSELRQAGAKVGECQVVDKRNGERVTVDVRVRPWMHEKTVQYSLCSPQGEILGYTVLKDMSEGDYAALKDFTVDGREVRNPLRYYGNTEEPTHSAVYVDQMQSYENRAFGGLGTNAHRVAVEHSFQIGAEGRVQLFVSGFGSSMSNVPEPGYSAQFHESFGFRAYDVYYTNGEVHHTGSSIHDKLERDREYWDTVNKKAATHFRELGQEDVSAKFDIPREKIRPSTSLNPKYDLPYMYLDAQDIARERERINHEPILKASKETIEALLLKHEFFQEQHYNLAKAEEKQKYRGNDSYSTQEYVAIADQYQRAGDERRAREFYCEAGLVEMEIAQAQNHFFSFIEAGDLLTKAGQTIVARGCYMRAVSLASGIKGIDAYLPELYQKADMEAEARSFYRDY